MKSVISFIYYSCILCCLYKAVRPAYQAGYLPAYASRVM